MVIPSYAFALGDKPIHVEYEATALDGEPVSAPSHDGTLSGADGELRSHDT
jgi:hypothetical protein